MLLGQVFADELGNIVQAHGEERVPRRPVLLNGAATPSGPDELRKGDQGRRVESSHIFVDIFDTIEVAHDAPELSPAKL